MPALGVVCSGFLLAVLWMDLMFDVQTLRYSARRGDLPEPVVASIAAYYRRVTTEAKPMGYLVGIVMGILTLLLLRDLAQRVTVQRLVALLLAAVPIGLALTRIFPSAIRLGRRGDSLAVQSQLARTICRAHLLCFAAMSALTALELLAME